MGEDLGLKLKGSQGQEPPGQYEMGPRKHKGGVGTVAAQVATPSLIGQPMASEIQAVGGRRDTGPGRSEYYDY